MDKRSNKPNRSFKENSPKKDTNTQYEFTVKEPAPLMEFLIAKMTSLSRNNIKSLLSRKQVAIDGACVSQFDFMLSKGDVVMIGKHSYRLTRAQAKKQPNLEIIYEDDEFIVINKPSGLLSIASDNEKEATAYHLLMDYYRKNDAHNRIYIVHRIDRDTSGVLMVAKNEKIRDILQKNWNDIVTKRGYYAVVEGKLEREEGTIKSWLRETKTNIMYSSHKPGDGQESITHYKVMKTNDNFSLVNVNIDSGRKNQIRVHMKDIGHMVVGDEKYGSLQNPLGRLGLHAYELSFVHPINHKTYDFVAPMPKEFTNFFNGKKQQEIEAPTELEKKRNHNFDQKKYHTRRH